ADERGFSLAATLPPTLPAHALDGLLGPRGVVVPDRHFADRTGGAMGAEEKRRESAGPDHQQARSVLARRVGGGKRRGSGRAPEREARAIHRGERLARLAIEKDRRGVDARPAARGISGKHRREL